MQLTAGVQQRIYLSKGWRTGRTLLNPGRFAKFFSLKLSDIRVSFLSE